MDLSHNPVADFLSGAFGGIETKLKDTADALGNGTADAAGITAKATAAVGSIPNAIACAEDIAKLAVEVETHDWKDVPATLLDFTTRGSAILKSFNVTLPGLTEVQSLLAKFVPKAA